MSPVVLAICLGLLSPWGVSALKQHRAVRDACKCRSFHAVYKSGDAKCGDGHEGGEVGKCERICPDEPGQKCFDWCADSYCRLFDGHDVAWWLFQNHSRCVRRGPDDRLSPTWCFVSPECTELNGGKVVNERVSTKYCSAADPKLGDLYPEELFGRVSPYETIITAMLAYDLEGAHDGEKDAPDFDALVEPPSPEYKSDCKTGRAERLNDSGEGTYNVVCRGGQEKWFVNDGIVECVRGCPAGMKLDFRAVGKRPRKEAWMYGKQGPKQEDMLAEQDDSNSYELTDSE